MVVHAAWRFCLSLGGTADGAARFVVEEVVFVVVEVVLVVEEVVKSARA